MTNLLQEIASNAEVAVTKAEQALNLVKGKRGRRFLEKDSIKWKRSRGKDNISKKQVRKVTANV